MPTVDDNLVVGGDSSPPEKAVDNNILVKSIEQIREEVHQQHCEIKEEHPIEDHYVIKKDGILERHFNTKSTYLTDMFSIESE